MKRVRRPFVYSVALICFAIPSICAPKEPFSLTIVPPQEPVKAGAELRLRITLRNTSDRSMTFVRSSGLGLTPEEGFRYQIDVHDAQGHPAPPSSYVREHGSGMTVTDWIHNVPVTLEPGESFIDEVTVTTFYNLSQPGKYTISVARPMPPRQNLGKGSVKSNIITVTVTQ